MFQKSKKRNYKGGDSDNEESIPNSTTIPKPKPKLSHYRRCKRIIEKKLCNKHKKKKKGCAWKSDNVFPFRGICNACEHKPKPSRKKLSQKMRSIAHNRHHKKLRFKLCNSTHFN